MNPHPFFSAVFSLRTVSAIRDTVLWCVAVVCLLAAIGMAVADRTAASGILFSAGILLCLVSNLSRFEFIKGLGVEAKTRELDQKINEAESLLEHIRSVSALMAKMSFHAMARIGRWDSVLPKDEVLSISEELVRQMRAVGLKEDVIENCKNPLHELNLRELIRPIAGTILNHMNRQNQEIDTKLRAIPQPVIPESMGRHTALRSELDRNAQYATHIRDLQAKDGAAFVAAVEKLIDGLPMASFQEKDNLLQEVEAALEDCRYYLLHKDFKNREQWLRKEWD